MGKQHNLSESNTSVLNKSGTYFLENASRKTLTWLKCQTFLISIEVDFW